MRMKNQKAGKMTKKRVERGWQGLRRSRDDPGYVYLYSAQLPVGWLYTVGSRARFHPSVPYNAIEWRDIAWPGWGATGYTCIAKACTRRRGESRSTIKLELGHWIGKTGSSRSDMLKAGCLHGVVLVVMGVRLTEVKTRPICAPSKGLNVPRVRFP